MSVMSRPPAISPDRPLEWNELETLDRLGFRSEAPVLARLIAMLEPPACFGIFGDWGSGKSTMMRAIQGSLEAAGGDKVLAVRFDTWKYDQIQGEELLFALLRAIEVQTNSGAPAWREVRKLALLGGTAGLSTIIRIATAGAVEITESVDTAVKVVDRTIDAYGRWTDAAANAEQSFGKAIAQALKHNDARRLVVFLDDLDRCLPQSITRLLEKLKNMLLAGEVIFVLGADRSAIVDAICGTYGTSRLFGERYLDKITVMSHDLRPHLPFSKYREWLATSDKKFGGTGDHPWGNMALYEALPHDWAGNPRMLKRVVERLCVISSVLDGIKHPSIAVRSHRLEFTGKGFPESRTPNLCMALTEFLVFLRERFPVAFSWYNDELFSTLLTLGRLRQVSTDTSDIKSSESNRVARVLDQTHLAFDSAGHISDILFAHLDAHPVHIRTVYQALGSWL